MVVMEFSWGNSVCIVLKKDPMQPFCQGDFFSMCRCCMPLLSSQPLDFLLLRYALTLHFSFRKLSYHANHPALLLIVCIASDLFIKKAVIGISLSPGYAGVDEIVP